MKLTLLGNVLAEHPQYPLQLLFFVDILDGDCVSQPGSNRLIQRCNRVFHKLIPSPR
jgi:hypothetical protein